MRLVSAGLAAASLTLLFATAARAQPFEYLPPGDLLAGSGEGRVDFEVYAPGMRFPMETGPAFANSQVYSAGGGQGPGGGQCDDSNYSYPWRDNYCEIRSWDMPLCPAGTGHQGQDIRAATCDNDVHWVVAAVAGTITSIGSYSVYLTGPDGTRYDYLHMGSVQVAVNQEVTMGQRIGRVSNEFGGTPTTIHLHFNLRQFVEGVGTVYVPPYMSLVTAYEALVGGPVGQPPEGSLDSVACDSGIRGWTRDPDAPATPIEARLTFDGAAGEPDVVEATLAADATRDDLCDTLGYCQHGIDVPLPLSLLDGEEHAVHAYGIDTEGGGDAELTQSPQAFTCSVVIPDGVRRRVDYPAGFAAWRFSAFWDQATIGDSELEAIAVGDDLPEAPLLVRGDDGSPEVWLADGGRRRLITGPEIADEWELDLGAIATWSAADVAALTEGTPLRPRPFLVKGSGETSYLIDDPQDGTAGPGGPGATGSSGGVVEDDGGAADGGCACRAGAGRAPGSLDFRVGGGLALAALAWMRRRGRAKLARPGAD
jgi:murein DD-endopeptidase MepM/ murein hydrolase activator NlpD